MQAAGMWLLVACALLVAVSANDLRPHLETSWTGDLSKMIQRDQTEMLDNAHWPSIDSFTLAPSGGVKDGATYYGDSRLSGKVTEHCHCVGCEGPPASSVHFTLADKGKPVVITSNGDVVSVGGVFRQVTWEQGHGIPGVNGVPAVDGAVITMVSEGPDGVVEFENKTLDFHNPMAVHRHYLSPAGTPQECAQSCEDDPQCKTSMWKDDVTEQGGNPHPIPYVGVPGVRCFKYYHTVERVECTGLPQFTCYQKKQTCTTGTDTSTPGVSDNYNGWYDVQRCGTCNEYCYWDGSTSGGDPQEVRGGTANNAVWKCRLADGTTTSAGHFLAATYGTNTSDNKHTTSSGHFPYQKCSGRGADTPTPASCNLVNTAYPTPTPSNPGATNRPSHSDPPTMQQVPTPPPGAGHCSQSIVGCCEDGETFNWRLADGTSTCPTSCSAPTSAYPCCPDGKRFNTHDNCPTNAPDLVTPNPTTSAPTPVPFIVDPPQTPAPTPSPTEPPTPAPTSTPTEEPSVGASPTPTEEPTTLPPTTDEPTFSPTPTPTEEPTGGPTRDPTEVPTPAPTPSPTEVPSTAAPLCEDDCRINLQIDYQGSDLIAGDGHTNVSSHDECCGLCHQEADCHFWTYANGNDTDSTVGNGRAMSCWLKYDKSGEESQGNRDSGASGCWVHGNGTSTFKLTTESPTLTPFDTTDTSRKQEGVRCDNTIWSNQYNRGAAQCALDCASYNYMVYSARSDGNCGCANAPCDLVSRSNSDLYTRPTATLMTWTPTTAGPTLAAFDTSTVSHSGQRCSSTSWTGSKNLGVSGCADACVGYDYMTLAARGDGNCGCASSPCTLIDRSASDTYARPSR